MSNPAGNPAVTNEEGPKKKRKKPDLPIVIVKTTADYQRMKLERLMANPDKKINLPIKPRDKNLPPPPEFVRNIMGSSAGAGSGEFHVYRHLRRKEYARQKYIQDKAKHEEKLDTFQKQQEEKQKKAEELRAKNRAKRLRKKMNKKKRKNAPSAPQSKPDSSSSESTGTDDETGPAQPQAQAEESETSTSDQPTVDTVANNPNSTEQEQISDSKQ